MKIQIMCRIITENLGFKFPLQKVLFVNQDIQKWLNTKVCIFYGEFKNEKKKGQNNFDLPEREFEPQIFSNFQAHELNFHGK